MLAKGNSWGGCQVAPSNQKTEKKIEGEEKEFAEKTKGRGRSKNYSFFTTAAQFELRALRFVA